MATERSLFDDWLQEGYAFQPLFDATVAWVNRLAREGSQGRLVPVLRALIESHHLRTEVVARLLSPLAAPALLRAAREAGPSAYQYFDAVRAFRPGRQGLRAFRDALRGESSLVVRLSATAVGLARDPDAVPILTGLLEDESDDVRRVVSNALGRIGPPAVPFLLGIIGDTSLSTSRRVRALTALRATGFRTDDVAPTLARCLEETDPQDHDLRRGLFMAGAKLRVNGLTRFAAAALVSDDWHTALAAAKLLTEAPDESADANLRSAIDVWARRDDPGHLRSLVVRQIAVALLRHPSAENQGVALELIRSGLRDAGPLDADDAAKLPDALSLSLGRGIVLDELASSMRLGPVTRALVLLFSALKATWRPADLDALADVAEQLERGGRAFAAPMIDAIIEATQGEEDSPLAVTASQIDAVQALILCQVPDLAGQLCRLLPYASDGLVRHVAYVLWVLGDGRAEDPLWAAFQSRAAEDYGDARSRHELIRALASCGTARSRDGILTYTRDLPRFAFEYDQEVLLPLMQRGVLSEEDLAGVVRDEHAALEGRVACIRALADLSPQPWLPLFRELLTAQPEPALQQASIVAIALAEDRESIPHLYTTLQKIVAPVDGVSGEPDTEEAASLGWVAATAAFALAILGDARAVPLIEATIDGFPGQPTDLARMVEALGQFAAPSSLPALLRLSQNRISKHVVDAAIEALGNYLADPDAEEAVLGALNSGSGGYDDRGSQLVALKTLARRSPNLLLDEVRDLYRLGHLESSARQWLALQAPYLARDARVHGDRFAELLASLMSDRDFWVRELLYQTVDRVPPGLVAGARARAATDVDPWKRASAVRLSGALDEESAEIEALRSDPDGLIRDAADAAAEARRSRRDLAGLVERFGSRDPAVRAAAFFALEGRGDEWAMHRLGKRYPPGTEADRWVGSLDTAVQYRRRDEHRKRGKEEDRRAERLDVVRFD
ncbi:MAG: HEAT repeat domain-containing protein [Actinomycetota bacterium]|nr:HEAT repeat domain-containing protein [Actinomycetota bacterium]